MIYPIIQPVSGRVRSSLEEVAGAASGGTCRIFSAWMSADGLSIANDLLMRNNVALKEILVGINRGGTSGRALRVALAILAQTGGTLRYYLDGKLAGPIFHPKIWFLESLTFRGAYIGSANLTREGLLNNVEAGLILTDQGKSSRNEVSDALDTLGGQLDALTQSDYSVLVSNTVVSRLVEIGAVPETSARTRDDADEGTAAFSNADDLLAIAQPRFRSSFRPAIALPSVSTERALSKQVGAASGVVSLLAGSSLRYVRYYGLSEANRVQKYFREGGNTGTFEPNLTMTTRIEERFWGFPDQFVLNQSGGARQWSPRVRLVTIRDGRTMVTIVPNARLWARIRDGRETEVRFRFANTAAVRDNFPRNIDELTVLVVDRADDDEADFEVRLVGRGDAGYAGLRPGDDRNYEYRIV